MTAALDLDLDVLVIGGGPAGSACAIRLARGGARVALVEASDFGRWRIGETIAPSIRSVLAGLGCNVDPLSRWAEPCTGVAAAWGAARSTMRPSLFNPYGRGWRIDRRALDGMLAGLAQDSGATVYTKARVADAARQVGYWTFVLRTAQGRRVGRCRYMIAATGRSAAAPLAPERSRLWVDHLVGLAFLSPEKDQAPASSALIEATADGWWYSVALPGGRPLAVFFTDSDLLPRGATARAAFLYNAWARAGATRERSSFAGPVALADRWKGFDARSGVRRVVMADGWIAVGDAAMAFDPLCGRGVAEALEAGVELAEWLLAGPPEVQGATPPWAHRAAARFDAYLVQRARVYGAEWRWSEAPFWRRRQWSPVQGLRITRSDA